MRPHVPVVLALGAFLLTATASAQVAGPPRAVPGRRGLDHGLPHPKPRPRPILVPTDYVVRCSEPTSSGEDLNVALTAPLPGSVTSAYAPDCPAVAVAGTAGVGKLLADLYFVIDSSGSTGRCTGSDIDGDGETGVADPFSFFSCTDPDDTVLAAEVRAVRDFVATLSPVVTRVAVIQFSMPEGSFGFGERQRIVTPLTSNFAQVGAALDEIRLAGPAGATDYGGAVQLLLQEYTTHGDRILRRQLCYFLSDGVPTYPVPDFGTEDPGDSQSALDATDVAAAAGIRLDTFGVGFIPSTTRDPINPRRCVKTTPLGPRETSTLECMAMRTGGEFFESTDPADIVDRLRQRQPARIESVTIFNDTNATQVSAFRTPDGVFTGQPSYVTGVINDLRVVVVAEDGTTCELHTSYLPLCFQAGCAPLTQGYWHRQCMGLGLIPPPGGGGGPPPHPDWDPPVLLELMAAIVDPKVAALGSPADVTTCQGLDADPPSEMCQKAIKQYTAVLMNIYGGKLGPDCVLDIPGIDATDPAGAASAIADLIREGLAGDESACQRANDAADLINTGAAIR